MGLLNPFKLMAQPHWGIPVTLDLLLGHIADPPRFRYKSRHGDPG